MQVIGIIILDYKFEKTKELERIHTKWKIKETLSGKELELTDVFELHIIEIPKARDILKKELANQIAQWMLFLDNPNEKEVFKIMEENSEIKNAMNELEELSNDEELRRVAELREKGIRDEKNGLRHARNEGIEQGIKKTKIEMAKKMIEENYQKDEIIKLTEITQEEFEKILKKTI